MAKDDMKTGETTDDLDGIVSDGVTLISDDSPEHIAEVLGVKLEPKEKPVEKVAETIEKPAIKADSSEILPETKPVEKPLEKVVEKDTVEKRIARANYELRQAEARERELAERAEYAERELAELRAKPAVVPEKKVASAIPETFQTWEEWSKAPAHEKLGYEDYLDARSDWRAAKQGYVSLEEVERIANERAQEQFTAWQRAEADAKAEAEEDARGLEFTTARETAKTKHEDYVAIVEETDLPTNPVMDEYIRRSGELAGELMYELGKNPDECRRIASLRTPAEVIKSMTRFEMRLEGSSRETEPVAHTITRAPLPIEPVGGARTTAHLPLDKVDFDEFRRRRDEQERAANARF